MAEYSLQKRLLNQDILPDSALSKELHLVKLNNERLLMEINTQYRTNEEMLLYLEK